MSKSTHTPPNNYKIIYQQQLLLILLSILGVTYLCPLHSRALSTKLLYGIILLMALEGVLAVFLSWWGVFHARRHFEANRTKELNASVELCNKYPDPHMRAQAQVFEEVLNTSSTPGASDIRFHQQERLRIILKALYPAKDITGQMPPLSTLRELSYMAEASRRPVWILRTVIAVLLITGILGTLMGVHDFLPKEQESIANITDIQPALIPSAIAVLCTIVLLILRSVFYRRGVDLLIGRLDRHTLRFYFPIFRPDTLGQGKIRELGNCLNSLNEALEDVGNSLNALSPIPEYGEIFHKNLQNKLQTIESVKSNIPAPSVGPEKLVAFQGRLMLHAQNMVKNAQQLNKATAPIQNDIENSLSLFEKVIISLTLDDKLSSAANHQQNLTEIIQPLHTALNKWPDKVQVLANLQKKSELLPNILSRAEDLCNKLNTMQESVVKQTKDSINDTAEISHSYRILSDEMKQNILACKNNNDTLSKACGTCSKWIETKSNELNKYAEYLSKLKATLEKRIREYDNKIKWWEWGIPLFLLSLLLINILKTFHIL